jgi:hypothetical protein
MIYSELGNNIQGLQYKDDPLAKTIAPDYEGLSMRAWGIPELDEMDKFAMKMDENLDTTPNEFNQYITGLNDVQATAQKFMKLGFDITKPSLDPRENAAHMEWLQKYNDTVALGKQLQQSRREKEKYNTMIGKSNVWTNPLNETKMVTNLDELAFAPDFDAFEKNIQSKVKKREQLFKKEDVDMANAELQAIKQQLDLYVDQVPEAFKKQAMQRAEAIKSTIPASIEDAQAQDKSRLGWARLNETSAYHKGVLDQARATLGWKKSQSAPIEFDTEQLIEKAGNGDIQAIDFINKVYGYNDKGEANDASLKVVNGSDLIFGIELPGDGRKSVKVLTDTKGRKIKVEPGKKYFYRIKPGGTEYNITPVDANSKKAYTNGLIGHLAEGYLSKNKTSNFGEEFSGDDDVQISAKKTNTNSGNNTTTTKSKETLRQKYKY